jgi:hypothetical protein
LVALDMTKNNVVMRKRRIVKWKYGWSWFFSIVLSCGFTEHRGIAIRTCRDAYHPWRSSNKVSYSFLYHDHAILTFALLG